MIYLAMFNWEWLAASAVIGLLMGWIAVVQRGDGLSPATMRKIAAVLAILILLAVFRLVPGRFGYWLDLGLVMFAAYLVGCMIGSWLRNLVVSRHASNA